jgi:hypothetical protein
MFNECIKTNIQCIRDYTLSNADLRERAHHFLYDKRYSNADQIQFVVMGINPGEPTRDPNIRGDIPLEETSQSDFLKDGIETRAAKRYRRICTFICGTTNVALTEALFWSSFNVQELENRYGRFRDSPHVRWCVPLNQSLLKIHRPRAVIFVGMGVRDEITQLYELQRDGEDHLLEKRERRYRIISPYRDLDNCPWIFTKHWRARLCKSEKIMIRDYVHSLPPRN